jgi:predicted amidohydrolase YtcJ
VVCLHIADPPRVGQDVRMSPPPHLVITGVKVWTGEASAGRPADAVAISGEQILAVGAQDDVLELAGPGTQRLHLPSRMVIPGFQDAHVHPPFAGRYRIHLSLHDLDSVGEYREAIAGYAAAHSELPWIYGSGWAAENFTDAAPTRDLLDDIVPDRPVFLLNASIHEAWVNSRALELAGVDARTPDPSDGRFGRDPITGEPTGALYEGAAYGFESRHLPVPGRADWQDAILNAQAHLHSLGITGWQDAWVTPATLAAYAGLVDDGRLTARVVAALWWERAQGLEQIAGFLDQRESGSRPGRLLARTVKIMTDGVLENRSGALLTPYQDGCGGHTDNLGLSYLDPDLLAAAVTELDRLDFQVHLHTIGDRAVRSGLDAIEAALTANGRRDNRHHLAHVQLIQPEDVPRFAALGVVANCQAYWAQFEPMMDVSTVPYIGAERARLQYPFADLEAAGARLAMGSDWSVTTADPLLQIEVAVTRVNPEQRSNPPFRPDQRLSLESALRAFTAGSAYVNHDPGGGLIRAGNRADLAILDRDLFTGAPPGEASVEYTIASGRIVHAAGQREFSLDV